MNGGSIMSKKILLISIVLQLVVLVLLLTGISLNRSGEQGIIFLYAGLINQFIVLALVIYLRIKKQQAKN